MKIKCLKCRDIIQGDKKGTLIRCSCEKVAIDETGYYTRIIGNLGFFSSVKDILELLKNSAGYEI